MEGEGIVSAYHGPNLFPEGTVHHAAEIGSVKGLLAVEQQQKQLRGYPALVVLEQRDDLLQCVPLHVAAERGHLDAVQHIVSHGVDLDAADGHQVRPLHLAAINNHCPVVKFLVDKGANVTRPDVDGDLPAHWAATKGQLQALEMLLDRGSPVDAHNKAGWTALHRAAFNGRVEACRLLLRWGSSIRAVTKAGCTALHLAASNNHLGVMELLLQLGASTHMRDQQGATAYDMCIGDAARGLLEEKEAGLSAGARSRPVSVKAEAPVEEITRVPHMPRFKPAANTNLDSDGFPTAEAELTSSVGLQGEASAGGDEDEGVAPDMLLLEQAGMGAAEDDGGSVMSGGLSEVYQGLQAYSVAASASFSNRPGKLSRQSSNKQQPGPLSASASFSRSRGGEEAAKQKLQPGWGSGKQKQAGINQRFLKQYSLDKKGLFAP